jgi:hypothetical protein
VSQRTERVDELLRQEIGSIITRDVADPRVGFATITSVETTPDLRHAKVWISVIGQPAERDATMAASGGRCRSSGTNWARAADQAIPDLTCISTTPPSGARGSCNCSASSRPA